MQPKLGTSKSELTDSWQEYLLIGKSKAAYLLIGKPKAAVSPYREGEGVVICTLVS